MAKLTRASLRKLREAGQTVVQTEGCPKAGAQVIVCMGTCGNAAGAQAAYDAIAAELATREIPHVELRRSGCMGYCHSEPTVEVAVPGMPRVIYGNVSAEVGKRIVTEHIVNRHLLDGHICDKPSIDIMAQTGGDYHGL